MYPLLFNSFINFTELFFAMQHFTGSAPAQYRRSVLANNLPKTCGFANWEFFLQGHVRSFSSLKKTIVLYLVEKLETTVEIAYWTASLWFATYEISFSSFIIFFILNILIIYWNFGIIFMPKTLKRAPISSQNVCLYFCVSQYIPLSIYK